MLQLTENFGIGSQVEITIVRSHGLIQAQELINGRTCYLLGTRWRILIGDRCRVTIVGEPRNKSFYFFEANEILASGDGQSSNLEKLLAHIERQGAPNFEESMLARMRAQRNSESDGPADMLELLLDLLEYHSLSREKQMLGTPSAPLNYGHYCIVIARLIRQVYNSDAQKQKELFARAAEFCRGRSEEWHSALLIAAR